MQIAIFALLFTSIILVQPHCYDLWQTIFVNNNIGIIVKQHNHHIGNAQRENGLRISWWEQIIKCNFYFMHFA